MAAPAAPTPPVNQSLLVQFKAFLMETNAMALAIAVVIGGSVTKLVSSLTDGLIMPIVSLILPGGDWRSLKLVLKAGQAVTDCPTAPNCAPVGEKAILYGQILGATLDFVIVAAVVFFVASKMLKITIKK
jgi:large conductance mechanosensitive channel